MHHNVAFPELKVRNFLGRGHSPYPLWDKLLVNNKITVKALFNSRKCNFLKIKFGTNSSAPGKHMVYHELHPPDPVPRLYSGLHWGTSVPVAPILKPRGGLNVASCDRTSASLATCQICLILLLVLHVSVMYLFVFGE